MHTIRSELQALACAALIRNQPLRPPRRRVIVALDIESSTSRPDPVKAELRTMLYELFDAALRSAGVSARRRDRFTDRGDGLLALIDPAVATHTSMAGADSLASVSVLRCSRVRGSRSVMSATHRLHTVRSSRSTIPSRRRPSHQ